MVPRFLLLFLFFPLSPALRAEVEPSLEELLPVYFIAVIQGEGNVQILKEGESQWRRAEEGTRLEEGDRILSGDDTEVILTLQSKALVHLDEDTEMTVVQLEETPSNGFISRLRLLTGSVLSDMNERLPQAGSKFELEAGGVTCRLRNGVFEVASNSDPVLISTREGVVQVECARGSRPVPAGSTCWASKARSPSVYPSSRKTRTRFQAWENIRHKILQKQLESGRPQPKTSLLLVSPSPDEYRLGTNGISDESGDWNGEKR